MLYEGDGTQKPQPGARIAFSHPLANGMAEAWAFLEGGGSRTTDLVSGRTALIPAAITWRAGALLWPTSPGASDYLTVSPNYATRFGGNGNAMTILACVNLPNVASRQTIYGCNNTTGVAQLEIGSSSGEVSGIISGTYIMRSSSSQFAASTWATIGVSRRGDGATNLSWVNGNDAGSVVNASNAYLNSDSTHYIGARTTAGSQALLGGSIRWLYVWNRALSQAEIRAVTAQPYAMFERCAGRRMIAIPAAAAGGSIVFPIDMTGGMGRGIGMGGGITMSRRQPWIG